MSIAKNPQFLVVNNTCQRCTVDNCLLCASGNTSVCQTCKSPAVLVNGTCYLNCPPGYYKNGLTCQPCDASCANCTSATTCKSCQPGWYLLVDKCVTTCPSGWVYNSKNECVKCHDTNCLLCNGNTPEQCLQCNPNTFMFNGKCKKFCDDGYYPQNQQCYPCSGNCTRCDSSYNCYSCKNGMKIQQGMCVDNCSLGYYYDQTSNTCYKCDDPNCQACGSAERVYKL